MTIDRHPEALVSTAWLAAHLDDPDLRIFECTTWLRPAGPDEGVPYHPEAGRTDYEAGHIPGAGFLDLPGELSRQDAPGRRESGAAGRTEGPHPARRTRKHRATGHRTLTRPYRSARSITG
jgi:3-mercaptopyruvate sulfurtransferase SseA